VFFFHKTDRMPEFAVVSLVGHNILYAVEHHPEIISDYNIS
jgi:hypothetical protein